MASDTIIITGFSVPTTNGAGAISVPDSSTDPVEYPGWSFDPDTDEYVDLFGECGSDFGGGTIEVHLPWLAASDTNTAHTVRWETFIEEILTDSSHTDLSTLDILAQLEDGVTSTLSAGGDKITTATIEIAGHGLVAGDKFQMRIRRDVSDDDLTGDAYLMEFLTVKEA